MQTVYNNTKTTNIYYKRRNSQQKNVDLKNIHSWYTFKEIV